MVQYIKLNNYYLIKCQKIKKKKKKIDLVRVEFPILLYQIVHTSTKSYHKRSKKNLSFYMIQKTFARQYNPSKKF